MVQWRIYYDDQSTFSSTDGRPEEAPGWGVVAIAQRVDPAKELTDRQTMYRWDHYCWHGDSWWGHDMTGLLDCLALPGVSVIRHGRTVDTAIFRAIMDLAGNDPDIPRG